MSDNDQTNYPNWTDEQWSRVTKAVSDEAQKARVAAELLPLYGPVDPSVVAVPNLALSVKATEKYAPLETADRLHVDSSPDLKLATLSVQVTLANHEATEPELLAALAKFRRAAITIARLEDAIVFNGQDGEGEVPAPLKAGEWPKGLLAVYAVHGGKKCEGLVPPGVKVYTAPGAIGAREGVKVAPAAGHPWPAADRAKNMSAWGNDLVPGVTQAIGNLEGKGHAGPYACFLSPDAYEAVHTPDKGSLVLPRDRIVAFLGGEYIRRTNAVPDGFGIIVALGGGPVEIVVASDISVKYLQQTVEPAFLFRVSEKIVLRVKEWDAVAVLHP
jgi:uncharacterized linocin/CFP29 family protein